MPPASTMRCWRRSASRPRYPPALQSWNLINERVRNPEGAVTIAIVGKYTGMKDAYKSLIEALSHGGIANKVKVNLDWIESEVFENEGSRAVSRTRQRHSGARRLRTARRGGQIRAAQFARERDVPYFGICFGMQMAVIEAARNLVGHRGSQFPPSSVPTPEPLVGLMTEWLRGNELEKTIEGRRSRWHPCAWAPIPRCSSAAAGCRRSMAAPPRYSERHRHRYEVNTAYKDRLEQHGLRFSGLSPDGVLPEIVEYEDHPWFIGVQFHPELKSRPFEPASIVCNSFIQAAVGAVAAGLMACVAGL